MEDLYLFELGKGFRMKKFSQLFLILFTFQSVFLVQRAYAFPPIIAIAYSAGGSVVSSELATTIGVVLTVGLAMAYLWFRGNDGTSVVIPVSGGVGGSANPVPQPPPNSQFPATTPGISTWNWRATHGDCPQNGLVGNSSYSSHAGALQGYVDAMNSSGSCSTGSYSYTAVNGQVCALEISTNITTCYYVSPGSQIYQILDNCPLGYSFVNSACTLTNSRLVIQDFRQDVSRNGQVMSVTLGDLAGNTNVSVMTTTTSDDTVGIVGTNGSGEPVVYTVTAIPGGGTTFSTCTQSTDGTGASFASITTNNIDSSGLVISTNTVTVLGTCEQSTPGVVAAIHPIDYSRVGEAGAAASSVLAGVSNMFGSIDEPSTIQGEDIPVTFASVVFTGSAICPAPISYSVNMEYFQHDFNLSYSGFCNLLAMIRPIVIAAGTITAAVIFMGVFS